MVSMFPYFLLNGKLSQVGPIRGKFCQPNCICSQVYIFPMYLLPVSIWSAIRRNERMVKIRSGVIMTRWKGAETWSSGKYTRLRFVTVVQHFHVAARRQGHLHSLLIKCFGWKPFLHMVACTSLK